MEMEISPYLRFSPEEKEQYQTYLDEASIKYQYSFINFSHIDPKYQTYQLFATCVKNGKYLNTIPKKFRTLDMCTESVLQNSWNLRFVPQHLHSFKLYELMLKNGADYNVLKEHCRKHLKTRKFWLMIEYDETCWYDFDGKNLTSEPKFQKEALAKNNEIIQMLSLDQIRSDLIF